MGIIRITDRIWKRFRAWVDGGPPAAPTTLTATIVDENHIRLDWDDVVGEDGYKLEAKVSGGSWVAIGEPALFPLYSVLADTITYTATCIAGYTWQFRICATNRYGDSDWLESAEITSYVNPPTSVTATQYTVSKANVAWVDNSAVETGFQIQRSDNGAAFAFLANVSANATTYTDNTISVGTTYSYKVSAIADGDDSNFSAQSSNLSPTYLYGYPTAQSAEPNVVLQFVLDESSGALIDEVSGITANAVGSPNYSQTLTGVYTGISPGVSYPAGANKHKHTTHGSTLINIGGSDNFTIEYWCMVKDTVTAGFWDIYRFGGVDGWTPTLYMLYEKAPNHRFYMYVRNDGGKVYQIHNAFSTTDWNDNKIHKVREVFTRGGNHELFFDGISTGTTSFTNYDTKTFSNCGLEMGNFSWCQGITFYEYRFSMNNTNNSGGPNGG